MGERIRQHIRSNVVGYLAVFLALTGGAYAIDGPLPGQDQVGSGDIINNEVRSADLRDANLTTVDIRGDAVTSGKIADGAVQTDDVLDEGLAAADIGADAVGADEIANPVRTLPLPLTSFVNSDPDGGPATLDFTPSDGTSPDLAMSGTDFVIEYDDDTDGAGPNVADTDLIQTTFTIPPDFFSGARFVFHVSKDAATSGKAEFLNCQRSVEPSLFATGDNVPVGSADIAAYTLALFGGGTFAPGASVNLRCWIQSNFPLEEADDIVRIHSVIFRYTATQ